MLHNRLTEQYGLDVPFVSAGMGFVAFPELAAAVSNAGGLGLLGSGIAPPPAVRDMIRKTRSLTSRPFGVDYVVADTALGPATTAEHIEVCIQERVPVVVFFWNVPPADWIARLRESGIRIWIQAGSIDRAKKAVAIGADGLIIQGSEAGGHNHSQAGLFPLLPAAVDAVSPVPVIAAGGIADGRGVAAALALGADGVCVGTRLIASQEAHAHEEYKRRVVAAGIDDIARTCIFGPEWPDQPMRVIRNRVVREWAGRDDRTPAPPNPSQSIGHTSIGGQEYPMPKFSAVLPVQGTTGDFEEMCLAAGESAGLVTDIKPAADIVRDMMTQAESIMSRGLRRR